MVSEFLLRFDRPQPLRRIVALADLARSAALAQLPPGMPAPMLAGKDNGVPLRSGHRHTHWLPWTRDARTLDGIVAWCPAGWSTVEREAVAAVRRLYDSRVSLWVTPGRVQWPAPATWWATLTPFVPGRHDVDPADDLARECRFRGLPAPSRVWVLPSDGRWPTLRPSRQYPRAPASPVRLVAQFQQQVPAPVTLGALAHFGLGMLWPVNPAALRERWGISCT